MSAAEDLSGLRRGLRPLAAAAAGRVALLAALAIASWDSGGWKTRSSRDPGWSAQ